MRELNLSQTAFLELSRTVLAQCGALSFRAHGTSMFPFIRDRDILTIAPVQAAALKVGEVIFFRGTGERLVAHRVIHRQVQGDRVLLTTRGDAAFRADGQVRAGQIIGCVVSVQRGEKVFRLDSGIWRWLALLWIRISPFNLLLIQPAGSVGPGIYLFLSWLRKFRKVYRL